MTGLVYVDSSVALAVAFREDGWENLVERVDALQGEGHEIVSSTLLRTEVRRVFFRVQRTFDGADDSVAWIGFVELDNGTVQRAGGLATHLKTLDAIHVAAAFSLVDEQSSVTLWTLDQQMRTGAQWLGLETLDEA